ncbi:bidirectional sugar transporter SWEET3b [Momordica charantia]|uniref:Bidirectional sugar transporter SWEET n=1 Tax=Momordica charantia TaxID=3673 RepID=A0A6J1DW39_MOMCH|nr:bidirectional sugar transporter SWEET3b [Momordica charantia]
MAVGVIGNAASLILYAVPILTFWRVIKKKSTEEFSCVPYILALMNCLLYTWYGLPVVSNGWENFLVVTINGFGILLEFSFIFIYFWFTSAQGKASFPNLYISLHFYSGFDFFQFTILNVPLKMVALQLLGSPILVDPLFQLNALVTVFCCVGMISTFVLHTHHLRKLFVGSIGLVASVAMYASPLVAMRQVIKTKSVEYMPFYLSFFSFSASSLWLAYGLLTHDLFLASPNLVGSPVGLLQIVLYCIYRNKEQQHQVVKKEEEDVKEPLPNWDLENKKNNNNA